MSKRATSLDAIERAMHQNGWIIDQSAPFAVFVPASREHSFIADGKRVTQHDYAFLASGKNVVLHVYRYEFNGVIEDCWYVQIGLVYQNGNVTGAPHLRFKTSSLNLVERVISRFMTGMSVDRFFDDAGA